MRKRKRASEGPPLADVIRWMIVAMLASVATPAAAQTPLTIQFTEIDSRAVEGGAPATVIMNFGSDATDRPLSIEIVVTPGTAEPGDYTVTGVPVHFAIGQTEASFTVTAHKDSEGDDETVEVAFGDLPAAVTAGFRATTRVNIDDPDPVDKPLPPVLSAVAGDREAELHWTPTGRIRGDAHDVRFREGDGPYGQWRTENYRPSSHGASTIPAIW